MIAWTRINSTGTFLISSALPWQLCTSTFRLVKSGKYRTATKTTKMNNISWTWHESQQLSCYFTGTSLEVLWEAIGFFPQNLQLRQDKVNCSQQRSPRSCGVHWKQCGCFFGSLLSPTGHTRGWALPLLLSPRAGICFSKFQVFLSILVLVNVA